MKNNPSTIITSLILCILLLSASKGYADDFAIIVSPGENETVYSSNPMIMFMVQEGSTNLRTAKIFVNNTDVTSSSILSQNVISYKPAVHLPPGKVSVKVIFPLDKDIFAGKDWEFTIKAPSLIKQIEHDAKGALMQGETLTVEMIGEPEGKAHFKIGEWDELFPMKEASSGVYQGTYAIKKGDFISNGKIKGVLSNSSGLTSHLSSEELINIDTRFFRVKILEPANNARVRQTFTLKGRTLPGAMVKISTSISIFNSNTTGSPSSGGLEVEADDKGYFEKVLGFPLSMDGSGMTINVTALDSKGEKSLPDKITVVLEQSKDENTSTIEEKQPIETEEN